LIPSYALPAAAAKARARRGRSKPTAPAFITLSTRRSATTGTSVLSSAARKPNTFLYTQQKPVSARIKSNIRVTPADSETDIHHVVLDFGGTDFTWLEGQNIGVLPAGVSGDGHAHPMRAYSIASDRDGETLCTHEMALTIKRVIDEWEGKPYYGVASNFMCDLKPGDNLDRSRN